MDLDAAEAPLAMPPPAAADGTPPAAAAPATEQTTADPAKPDPAKPDDKPKPDESERVIELARARREAEGKATEAEQRATAAEANVKKLEPVIELLKLAETDPLAAIREMADVMGLSPERVLEAIQTTGAGGDVELTAEDKIARLERQLEELRTGRKPEDEDGQKKPETTAGEQARQGYIDTFSAILEASPEQFPHAAKDADAPQAAFLVMVRDWEKRGREPDYKPLPFGRALAAVERVLAGNGQPTTGGLSSRSAGPVIPDDPDRVLSDAEIRADLLRRMNAR